MGKGDEANAAKGTDVKKEKKERKRRFPSKKSFKEPIQYYDYMIKYWHDKKEDFIKNGDGTRKRAVKKANRIAGELGKLMENPETAAILKEALAKVGTKK